MFNLKEKFSIQTLSLKRKIWIAVSLITLLPLIVLFYHLGGFYISFKAVTIACAIMLLGWFLIFEVFSSIVRVYSTSRKALKNIGEETPEAADEVKSLESIIEILSSKMKNGLEQLKEFSQRAEELNQEVSRKVFVLSSILQANDLFSKEVPSEEIVQFLNQRVKEILNMKISCCLLRDAGVEKFNLISSSGIEIAIAEQALLNKDKEMSRLNKSLFLDKRNKNFPYPQLAQELGLMNIAIVPIISKNYTIGLIIIGNSDNKFCFCEDDLNVLSLFSQNVALIWEHKRLSVKVDELEVCDYLTGLYNSKYIEKRLAEEIARATSYQRPCALLLVQIANYSDYQAEYGLLETERIVKKAAKIFKESLRSIDVAGRISANQLCAVVIEKNKRQSQVLADELKDKLENNFKEQIAFQFCVAENPIDGTTAKELIQFAQSNINSSGR
jgi:diguanylate cyclase (GGDEF)-like protein